VQPAHHTLLLQSRSHACRLLGRRVTAHDVLNVACLWVIIEADFNTVSGIDFVAGLREFGLESVSCDNQIEMLRDIAKWSRLLGPIA
jgi:hypothetical protein